MTAEIQRLDYSKPPPGYRIAWRTHGAREWVFAVGERDVLEQFASEGEVVAAAWSHVKVHNDPPGVIRCGLLALYVTFGPGLPQFLSRADAWAWYDRRLSLANRIDDLLLCDRCGNTEPHIEGIDATTTSQPWCTECDVEMGGLTDVWPECLTWSDEQASEVERWLVDSTAEMPDVLNA